jgi:ferrous iron transport protein A
MTDFSLGDMAVGDKGQVVRLVRGNRSYRDKLLSMGLLPGTEFRVPRVAPLGDPVEINVRGYAMTLRKDEAKMLTVRRVEP